MPIDEQTTLRDQDIQRLVLDSAERIFADHCAPDWLNRVEAGDASSGTLWQIVEEAGLPLAWVPEESGGAGCGLTTGFGVIRLAARYGAPIPLAETLLTNLWLARSGIELPGGSLSLALAEPGAEPLVCDHGSLDGQVVAVPWGRQVDYIAVPAWRQGQQVLALVARASCDLEQGTNLAGEARDTLLLSGRTALSVAPLPTAGNGELLRGFAAAVRAQQIAGALERMLELTVDYVRERKQFGRPLARFQAVQQAVAELAGEVAAADAAASLAVESLSAGDSPRSAMINIATAKIRAGEAATRGAVIAQQMHGAMGFSREYPLQYHTRRVWSWREEYGSESDWSLWLGQQVLANCEAGVWCYLTSA